MQQRETAKLTGFSLQQADIRDDELVVRQLDELVGVEDLIVDFVAVSVDGSVEFRVGEGLGGESDLGIVSRSHADRTR